MEDRHYRYDEALRARVAANLGEFERTRIASEGLKHAAVAMTLVRDDNGEGAYVLTRRASRLNTHASQFALPGGRIDDGETPIEGALRELREEVNLHLAEDAVLGLLDDYPTQSGYLITPIVVWAGADAEMQANPHEVERIHRITFRELNRPDSPEFVDIPESERPVIRLLMGDDDALHAPTAAMVYQFREVGLFGRQTRVAHLGEPVWAWR
ncbi:MAG: CoA pyrophosphatase [Alphaproteobacteria bacterium]|nr:CoA pyrophosphatase [Alphaproteobacteria bacterium]MDP6813079.1 CoA pyrophosphatase [Alphaproteobacteria bacterium]